jgi:Uma2 family endonuclease
MKTLELKGEGRTLLENVRWSTYEALLEDTGPHRGKIAYEEGLLEIMSPSGAHERLKTVIRSLVEAFAAERGIKIVPFGSLTLKRELLQRGAEPDECYYIQNAAGVWQKEDVDVAVDPPPDLVIEIEISKSALNKLGIYSALGVPELWLHDGEALRVFVLEPGGSYVISPRSQVLSGLPFPEFERFLSSWREKGAVELAEEFRALVRNLPR